jgi:ATP-dependent DNA helicase RecG
MTEHQNIEYKTSWRDEYLKWICGFANAQGGKIFVGIDDKGQVAGLEIWNPGKLPEELTIEKLKGEHSSYPRNANIAGAFFKAGYIESWGRGVNNIITECLEAGLPEPVVEEDQGGIRVTFLKDIYTEEYLRRQNINERQIKAVLYVKEHGSITNSIYQTINSLGKSISAFELADLVNKRLLERIGHTGRGIKYLLKK